MTDGVNNQMQKNATEKNDEIKPQLSFKIPQELDIRFRETVFRSKGMKKGFMRDALTEALELWIKANAPVKLRGRSTTNE